MHFQEDTISGDVLTHDDSQRLTIKGKIEDNIQGGSVIYFAANPPDSQGHGFPFASPEQAFDNTPHLSEVKLQANNRFVISIHQPNSYYTGLGTFLQPPTLFIKYMNNAGKKVVAIKVGQACPYRLLTYPHERKQKGTMFYDNVYTLPVRTQEQILRDSSMGTNSREGFWGLRPSL